MIHERSAVGSDLFLFILQLFKLPHECFKILEFSVDRSKTNVRNVVQAFELIHDQNTDMLGRNFPVQGILQLALDFRSDLLHLSCRDGAFIAGFDDARKQFAFVKHLTGSILFDDDQGQTFHHLIGGKSFLTGNTFASAANAAASLCGAGIDDYALRISANRTLHGLYLQK